MYVYMYRMEYLAVESSYIDQDVVWCCSDLLSWCFYTVPKFPYQATSTHRWFGQVPGIAQKQAWVRAQTLKETFSFRRLSARNQPCSFGSVKKPGRVFAQHAVTMVAPWWHARLGRTTDAATQGLVHQLKNPHSLAHGTLACWKISPRVSESLSCRGLQARENDDQASKSWWYPPVTQCVMMATDTRGILGGHAF